MSRSSVIIHKGRREEKYKIYVEDYVLSFLKAETGTLELSEFSFYGIREGGRKYTIYGAGRGGQLSFFDKYSPLDEIGCRLTQAGPVFLVREENGLYEVKGYDVFYKDNQAMQNYLIERRQGSGENGQNAGIAERSEDAVAGGTYPLETLYKKARRSTDYDLADHNKPPHSMISVQLCVILTALVAIVINSANSYDKMEQLNQSAEEVFFAMENQEAQDKAATDEVKDDIVVARPGGQEEDVLKLAALENAEQTQADAADEAPAGSLDPSGTQEAAGGAGGTEEQPENGAQAGETAEDGTQTEGTAEDGAQTGETAGDGTQTEGTAEDGAQAGEAAGDGTQTEGMAEDGAQTEETAGNEAAADEENPEQEGIEALSRNVARYYEVERGDTLYMISREIYGDTSYVKEICELNKISDPDHIQYGQKIRLP